MSDLAKVPCVRCGAPSHATWHVCALVDPPGAEWGICQACDVELNAVVLEFFNFPDREKIMADYRASKGL